MAEILFFGRLSDLSGPLVMDLPREVKTTDDLRQWLSKTYPALTAALEQNTNRVAVNKIMITQTMAITNADEIAFMSPLSGG